MTVTPDVEFVATYMDDDNPCSVVDWQLNTSSSSSSPGVNESYTADLCADSADCGIGWVLSNVVPVIFCVIAVFGFVGNIAVVAAIASDQRLRTTTNTVVLSLALADLVFICICVPFTAVLYSTSQWTLGVAWCKLYQYLIHVTAYASVYTLVRHSVCTVGLLWLFILRANIGLDANISNY